MEATVEVRIPLGVLAPTVDISRSKWRRPIECSEKNADGEFCHQRIAVCDATGLLAIANGRVIDLYYAESIHISEPISDKRPPPAVSRDGHLPFAGQIVLGDHLDAYLDDQQDAAGVYATCVAFVTPGFLLVAIAACSSSSPASWLCGFRMYARTVAIAQRHGPSSLLVHCAFADHLPGIDAVGTLESAASTAFATREAGAVVVLFTGASNAVFGVFQWVERFSDRALAIARLPRTASPLSAVAISNDARWIALTDESGAIHLLDFARFTWELNQRVDAQSIKAGRGKRLVLDASYRMGRVASRDHPLDGVRLVVQARTGAATAFGTSLRWWRPQMATIHITKRAPLYLLMGQNDGALAVMVLKNEQDKHGEHGYILKTVEIYPAIRSIKKDAIGIVSEPQYCKKSKQFCFSTISKTSWRQWTVSVTEHGENEKVRLHWPTLVDVMSLRTLEVEGHQSYGCLLLPPSSLVARGFAAAVLSHQNSTGLWLLNLMRAELRATAPVEKNTEEETVADVQEPAAVPSRPTQSDITDTQEQTVAAKIRATPAPVPDTHQIILTTLQDRYKLPSMRDSLNNNGSPSGPVDQMNTSVTNQRLTQHEYNLRLAGMAQRIDRLHTTLHTLRHSFQLFTSDVQQHMTFISNQLEEIQTQSTHQHRKA